MTVWIVSNRLPFSLLQTERGEIHLSRSNGGLVSALLPVHRDADSYWVGSMEDSNLTSAEKKILQQNRLIKMSP